jgi:hypothetical protein
MLNPLNLIRNLCARLDGATAGRAIRPGADGSCGPDRLRPRRRSAAFPMVSGYCRRLTTGHLRRLTLGGVHDFLDDLQPDRLGHFNAVGEEPEVFAEWFQCPHTPGVRTATAPVVRLCH